MNTSPFSSLRVPVDETPEQVITYVTYCLPSCFTQLIINPALWAPRGLESPLSVVLCSDQELYRDTIKFQFIRGSSPPDLSMNIKIGHSCESETYQVETVSWDTMYGTRIKLVDTPGFDYSWEGVTDAEVLDIIATFLAKE